MIVVIPPQPEIPDTVYWVRPLPNYNALIWLRSSYVLLLVVGAQPDLDIAESLKSLYPKGNHEKIGFLLRNLDWVPILDKQIETEMEARVVITPVT